MQVVLGLFILLAALFVMSEDRKSIPWKLVGGGIAVQFLLALFLIKVPFIAELIAHLNGVVQVLEKVTTDATGFMFGYLAGGDAPFESVRPQSEFIVAFRVLPLIMVISAVSAVLYHWRVLPWIINGISKFIVKVLKVRGPLAFGSAASIFLGTIEAPLFIRPYLMKMSRSDLFALITCTMSTIAGTVMVLYASVVGQVIPNAMGHMIGASLISVPAALLVAKAMIPEIAEGAEQTLRLEDLPRTSKSTMDALIKGTMEGLDMVLKIVAIIIVLFALVYLLNHLLAWIPRESGPLTVETIAGTLLQPVMWLIGIPWAESSTAGTLMGTKVILNEFVAYLKLSGLASDALSEDSRLIVTYALCGFANLGSVGILVGGLGAMLPERSEEVTGLCMRALISGNIATLMTAAIVGLIV